MSLVRGMTVLLLLFGLTACSFVGFDVDVAGHLGIEPSGITWRETISATRETDLTSGTVELVVATYSITDKRKQLAQAVQPIEHPRYPNCVTALLAGQVDAVTTDDAIQEMIDSGRWLDSLRTTIGPSGYPLPGPPAVTER